MAGAVVRAAGAVTAPSPAAAGAPRAGVAGGPGAAGAAGGAPGAGAGGGLRGGAAGAGDVLPRGAAAPGLEGLGEGLRRALEGLAGGDAGAEGQAVRLAGQLSAQLSREAEVGTRVSAGAGGGGGQGGGGGSSRPGEAAAGLGRVEAARRALLAGPEGAAGERAAGLAALDAREAALVRQGMSRGWKFFQEGSALRVLGGAGAPAPAAAASAGAVPAAGSAAGVAARLEEVASARRELLAGGGNAAAAGLGRLDALEAGLLRQRAALEAAAAAASAAGADAARQAAEAAGGPVARAAEAPRAADAVTRLTQAWQAAGADAARVGVFKARQEEAAEAARAADGAADGAVTRWKAAEAKAAAAEAAAAGAAGTGGERRAVYRRAVARSAALAALRLKWGAVMARSAELDARRVAAREWAAAGWGTRGPAGAPGAARAAGAGRGPRERAGERARELARARDLVQEQGLITGSPVHQAAVAPVAGELADRGETAAQGLAGDLARHAARGTGAAPDDTAARLIAAGGPGGRGGSFEDDAWAAAPSGSSAGDDGASSSASADDIPAGAGAVPAGGWRVPGAGAGQGAGLRGRSATGGVGGTGRAGEVTLEEVAAGLVAREGRPSGAGAGAGAVKELARLVGLGGVPASEQAAAALVGAARSHPPAWGDAVTVDRLAVTGSQQGRQPWPARWLEAVAVELGLDPQPAVLSALGVTARMAQLAEDGSLRQDPPLAATGEEVLAWVLDGPRVRAVPGGTEGMKGRLAEVGAAARLQGTGADWETVGDQVRLELRAWKEGEFAREVDKELQDLNSDPGTVGEVLRVFLDMRDALYVLRGAGIGIDSRSQAVAVAQYVASNRAWGAQLLGGSSGARAGQGSQLQGHFARGAAAPVPGPAAASGSSRPAVAPALPPVPGPAGDSSVNGGTVGSDSRPADAAVSRDGEAEARRLASARGLKLVGPGSVRAFIDALRDANEGRQGEFRSRSAQVGFDWSKHGDGLSDGQLARVREFAVRVALAWQAQSPDGLRTLVVEIEGGGNGGSAESVGHERAKLVEAALKDALDAVLRDDWGDRSPTGATVELHITSRGKSSTRLPFPGWSGSRKERRSVRLWLSQPVLLPAVLGQGDVPARDRWAPSHAAQYVGFPGFGPAAARLPVALRQAARYPGGRLTPQSVNGLMKELAAARALMVEKQLAPLRFPARGGLTAEEAGWLLREPGAEELPEALTFLESQERAFLQSEARGFDTQGLDAMTRHQETTASGTVLDVHHVPGDRNWQTRMEEVVQALGLVARAGFDMPARLEVWLPKYGRYINIRDGQPLSKPVTSPADPDDDSPVLHFPGVIYVFPHTGWKHQESTISSEALPDEDQGNVGPLVHAIIREVFFNHDPAAALDLSWADLKERSSSFLKEDVSAYAATPLRAVAEIGSAVVHRISLPQQAFEVYRAFGGPPARSLTRDIPLPESLQPYVKRHTSWFANDASLAPVFDKIIRLLRAPRTQAGELRQPTVSSLRDLQAAGAQFWTEKHVGGQVPWEDMWSRVRHLNDAGVQVTVRYFPGNESVDDRADDMALAVRLVVAAGLRPPSKITLALFENLIADGHQAHARNGIIYFFPLVDYESDGTSSFIHQRVSRDPAVIRAAILVHEIIHLIHEEQASPVILEELRGPVVYSEDAHGHFRQLSDYAAKNPVEGVAEAGAALVFGLPVSQEVMTAYRAFGGPEPDPPAVRREVPFAEGEDRVLLPKPLEVMRLFAGAVAGRIALARVRARALGEDLLAEGGAVALVMVEGGDIGERPIQDKSAGSVRAESVARQFLLDVDDVLETDWHLPRWEVEELMRQSRLEVQAWSRGAGLSQMPGDWQPATDEEHRAVAMGFAWSQGVPALAWVRDLSLEPQPAVVSALKLAVRMAGLTRGEALRGEAPPSGTGKEVLAWVVARPRGRMIPGQVQGMENRLKELAGRAGAAPGEVKQALTQWPDFHRDVSSALREIRSAVQGPGPEDDESLLGRRDALYVLRGAGIGMTSKSQAYNVAHQLVNAEPWGPQLLGRGREDGPRPVPGEGPAAASGSSRPAAVPALPAVPGPADVPGGDVWVPLRAASYVDFTGSGALGVREPGGRLASRSLSRLVEEVLAAGRVMVEERLGPLRFPVEGELTPAEARRLLRERGAELPEARTFLDSRTRGGDRFDTQGLDAVKVLHQQTAHGTALEVRFVRGDPHFKARMKKVVEALGLVARAGFDMPARLVVWLPKYGRSVEIIDGEPVFEPVTSPADPGDDSPVLHFPGVIYVFPHTAWKGRPSTLFSREFPNDNQRYVGPLVHAIIREVFFNYDSAAALDLSRARLNERSKDFLAEHVSSYAATPVRAVAEIGSAVVFNTQLPPKAFEVYRALGGPPARWLTGDIPLPESLQPYLERPANGATDDAQEVPIARELIRLLREPRTKAGDLRQPTVSSLQALRAESYQLARAQLGHVRWEDMKPRVVPISDAGVQATVMHFPGDESVEERIGDFTRAVRLVAAAGLRPPAEITLILHSDPRPGGNVARAGLGNIDYFPLDETRESKLATPHSISGRISRGDKAGYRTAILVHEIIHLIHDEQAPGMSLELHGPVGYSGAALGHFRGLSVYAATKPVEGIAEVGAALVYGLPVSQEVMKAYEAFRGPEPAPGVVQAEVPFGEGDVPLPAGLESVQLFAGQVAGRMTLVGARWRAGASGRDGARPVVVTLEGGGNGGLGSDGPEAEGSARAQVVAGLLVDSVRQALRAHWGLSEEHSSQLAGQGLRLDWSSRGDGPSAAPGGWQSADAADHRTVVMWIDGPAAVRVPLDAAEDFVTWVPRELNTLGWSGPVPGRQQLLDRYDAMLKARDPADGRGTKALANAAARKIIEEFTGAPVVLGGGSRGTGEVALPASGDAVAGPSTGVGGADPVGLAWRIGIADNELAALGPHGLEEMVGALRGIAEDHPPVVGDPDSPGQARGHLAPCPGRWRFRSAAGAGGRLEGGAGGGRPGGGGGRGPGTPRGGTARRPVVALGLRPGGPVRWHRACRGGGRSARACP